MANIIKKEVLIIFMMLKKILKQIDMKSLKVISVRFIFIIIMSLLPSIQAFIIGFFVDSLSIVNLQKKEIFVMLILLIFVMVIQYVIGGVDSLLREKMSCKIGYNIDLIIVRKLAKL